MRFILAFVFVFSLRAEVPYNPATDLRQAFCAAPGVFLQEALNQTNALANIVESLKSDAACSSIAQGASSIVQTLTNLKTLEDDDNRLDETNLALEKYEQEYEYRKNNFINTYMAENEDATDEMLSTALSEYLASDTVMLGYSSKISELTLDKVAIELDYENNAGNSKLEKRQELLKSLSSNITASLGSLSASSACTNDNPTVVSSILSSIVGLGSTAFGGLPGTAIALGAELIGTSAELIRNIKFNTKFRKLRDIDMTLALSCSYEGMANTYCRARDAITLIRNRSRLASSKNKINCPTCTTVKFGTDLIYKKSQVFNLWIDKVLAGATPRDLNAVDPIRRAEKLVRDFSIVKKEFEGIFNEARRDFRLDAVAALRNLVTSLGKRIVKNGQLAGNDGRGNYFNLGAYSNSFSSDRRCGPWFFLYSDGSNRESGVSDFNADCETEARKKYPNASFSIEKLEALVSILNAEAEIFVANERQKVAEENSIGVLADLDSFNKFSNSSPRTFMNNLINFYSQVEFYLESYDGQKRFLLDLIEQSMKQINDSLRVIAFTKCEGRVLVNPDDPEEEHRYETRENIKDCAKSDLAKEQLAKIGLILAPNQQVLSVESALRKVFKLYVDILVQNDEIENTALLTLLNELDGERATVIARYVTNAQKTLRDAQEAMATVEDNLEVFSKMFERDIHRILKKEKKNLSREYNRQRFAMMCISSLLTPKKTKLFGKISALCRGAKYENLIGKPLEYNKLAKFKFEKRACVLYEFNRKVNFLNNQ